MLDRLTVLVKAFERPEALDRCLISLRKTLPGVRVIIADDSEVELTPKLLRNESIIRLPFDSGLSAGRNSLMGQLQTQYFLLIDDDTVLDRFEPKILELLEGADRFDVVAGVMDGIEDWKGCFRLHHGRLVHLYNRTNDRGGYDFVANFFVGRKDTFDNLRWDEELKICEHSEFFYRNTLHCGVSKMMKGSNARDRSDRYNQFRGRRSEFQEIEKRKIGVDYFDFVDPNCIRALLIKNPKLYDHPQGCMQDFGDRLGDGNTHNVDTVWESDVKDNPNFPWHKYNLVISNFTWFGPNERPPHIRCVYINDDLHWNANEQVKEELTEIASKCDMFLSPYAHHANRIPEYSGSHHKFVTFPYALPWWFEPRQWEGRKSKVTISGGTHAEIYPLRTEIVEAVKNGYKSDLEWLGDHPGWSIDNAPSCVVRGGYAQWLGDFKGGIAAFGYGRYPSENIPYLVCKYLEVAAATCPFFEELPDDELKMLGFEPYEHYIPITKDNWKAVIREWLEKPDEMREIFLRSSALVSSNHYTHHRVAQFWELVKGVFGWD